MTDFQSIPWDNIVQFGQKTLLDSRLFTVSWITTRYCNYSCSYCWPYARSSVPDKKPLELYLNTVDSIKAQARANNFTDFHFSFSGGEPTALKGFLDIIEHYANDTVPEYQSIHMTSNISPGPKWWDRWLTTTHSLQRRSITASFHAEHADETEFGDKCLQLIDNDVFVTVNQVMVPEYFDEYYDRCQRLWDRGINVTLKPQSDPTASYIVGGYTNEQRDILQTGFPQIIPNEYRSLIPLYQVELTDDQNNKYYLDQAERFNAFDFNKFKGWTCNAGYQGIVIRDTEVKRSYSCDDEPLGTLVDGFEIFKNPKKCITKTCVSSADSKLPKVKYES